jgi:hypothetical protein
MDGYQSWAKRQPENDWLNWPSFHFGRDLAGKTYTELKDQLAQYKVVDDQTFGKGVKVNGEVIPCYVMAYMD